MFGHENLSAYVKMDQLESATLDRARASCNLHSFTCGETFFGPPVESIEISSPGEKCFAPDSGKTDERLLKGEQRRIRRQCSAPQCGAVQRSLLCVDVTFSADRCPGVKWADSVGPFCTKPRRATTLSSAAPCRVRAHGRSRLLTTIRVGLFGPDPS